MSASQPASPEPHEPAHPLVPPADEPLRAMADADEVVWYIPEPDAPDAEVLPPSTDPEQRKIEPRAKPPAATATPAPAPKAAPKPRAAAKAAPKTRSAAKPKAPSKPRATATKPASPKPASAKPTSAKTATSKPAGARATAKPTGPSATPAKPRAPRRKAVAWPAPAPQAVPTAPAPAPRQAPTPVAEQTPTFRPTPVPDPAPSTAPAPAPDPNFVPQRPTIERREHVREPEHPAPAFRSPPPASPPPQQAAAPVAPILPAPPTPMAAPIAAAPVAPAPVPAAPVAPAPIAPAPIAAAPVAPAPVPAAPVAPAPVAPAPAPSRSPAPPTTHREAILAEAASKAPPGFSGVAIQAAESRTLLALDPVEDETTRPAPAVVKEIETVGGSAILGAIKNAVPRSGDTKQFGRDQGATVRVSIATIVAAVLVVALGPAIEHQLIKLPFVGPMFGQLQSFTLYPSAYGVASIAATLCIVSAAGVVVAQMESTANKVGRRQDPNTRLNIGMAALIALIFTSGLMSTMKAHGWAASAASVGFFAATCLLVPLGNLPGARALRHLPSRAWGAAFVLSIVGLVIYPSLPGALITLLTFTHVRTNWRAVADGQDEAATGPIKTDERRSAALITAFALIAAAVGMHAMTLSPAKVRAAVNASPDIPGVVKGEQIAPPKTR